MSLPRATQRRTWWVRRLVVAPLVVGLALVVWTALPVWLLLAAMLSPVLPGRWRALRLFWLTVVYLTLETTTLAVLLGWWVASGFGRRIRTPYFEGLHYDLVQGVTWVLFTEAGRVLNLRIRTDGPAPDAHPGFALIVACRHAGPGDSLVLLHALMQWYHREPRVVLKDTLAWDPMVDVVLHRVPARFLGPGAPGPSSGDSLEAQVSALAADLDDDDAFVIFPEGGNFTPGRRTRSIASLRQRGLSDVADRAESMAHVLPPRPGGLLAALEAAPEADVVMVAHTGLDHLLTARDLWREIPMDQELVMRWWRVRRAEIPAGREAQIDWLFAWWERIDAWVGEHRPEPIPPGAVRRQG